MKERRSGLRLPREGREFLPDLLDHRGRKSARDINILDSVDIRRLFQIALAEYQHLALGALQFGEEVTELEDDILASSSLDAFRVLARKAAIVRCQEHDGDVCQFSFLFELFHDRAAVSRQVAEDDYFRAGN